MKKVLFILISFSLFFAACEKDKTTSTTKNTRLKTYAYKAGVVDYLYKISYNSFNKIDKVEWHSNGALLQTYYCVYNSDQSLDSLIQRRPDNSLYLRMNIDCKNFKITKVGYDEITYNSNNLVSSFVTSSSEDTYEYFTDSVRLKSLSKVSFITSRFTYVLSNSIKNPFLFTGFEKEAYLSDYIFYTISGALSFMPYAYIQLQGVTNITYAYDGNFNGYPLKRISDNGTEIFTYEEF